MDPSERPWDASPLIGLLLIIPALLYFSWWWQFTGRFLQHAQQATAQVTSLERHVGHGYSKYRGSYTYIYYYTLVRFKNAAGQDTPGEIQDSHSWAQPGATIQVYYAPDHPDVRFGGLDGVWGGLALVVGVCLLGVAASFLAWRATRNRPGQSAGEEWSGELGDI